MGAPKGSQFWLRRSSHGPKVLFATEALLWEACCEYFQWVEDNPLQEQKIISYQGAATKVNADKLRCMTVGGLCLYLDISAQTWNTWRTKNNLSETVQKCDAIIREQKFTGAAADLFNANIIARDLGLVDKQEVTTTEAPHVAADMSPSDAARAYQDLMDSK